MSFDELPLGSITARQYNKSKKQIWALIVAQLAERLPLIIVVLSLNPVIGKFLLKTYLLFTVKKIRRKRREWLINKQSKYETILSARLLHV